MRRQNLFVIGIVLSDFALTYIYILNLILSSDE